MFYMVWYVDNFWYEAHIVPHTFLKVNGTDYCSDISKAGSRFD
jgi:hypothetical protein